MLKPRLLEQGYVLQINIPRLQEWSTHDIIMTPSTDKSTFGWNTDVASGTIRATVPNDRVIAVTSPDYILHVRGVEGPLHIKQRRTQPEQPTTSVQNAEGEGTSRTRVQSLSVLQFVREQAGRIGRIQITDLDVAEDLSLGNAYGNIHSRSRSTMDIRRSSVMGIEADSTTNEQVREVTARTMHMNRNHLWKITS